MPRTELEWRLVRIFETVLQRQPLRVTDDFFAHGGDSLAAVQVFSSLAHQFQVDLPLSVLFEAPTPRALAARLDPRVDLPAHGAIVAMNGGDADAVPLFVVPGGGSDAFAIHELALAFHARRRVFATSYPGLDGTSPFLRSVEALADHFLPHVIRLAGDAPVDIVGCSFGGLVAVELVRQLRESGRSIGLLALLDTYGPAYPKLRSGDGVRSRLLRKRWNTIVAQPGSHGIQRGARRLLARTRLMLQPKFSQPRMDRRFLYLREAAFAAHKRYRPVPLDVDALLVRMTQQPDPDVYEEDPLLGWGQLLRGDLDVAHFDGGHGDYLREPLAAKVATLLEDHRLPRASSLAIAPVEP